MGNDGEALTYTGHQLGCRRGPLPSSQKANFERTETERTILGMTQFFHHNFFRGDPVLVREFRFPMSGSPNVSHKRVFTLIR